MEEYKGIINELISKYYKEVLVINVFDDKIYKYNYWKCYPHFNTPYSEYNSSKSSLTCLAISKSPSALPNIA